jgi:antitoxin ParD1/3/4
VDWFVVAERRDLRSNEDVEVEFGWRSVNAITNLDIFCHQRSPDNWRATMNVSLTPELDRLVQEKVASGLYQTASEVVREGLRLLEAQDQMRTAQLAQVRSKIDRGLEQLDAGRAVSSESAWKRIHKKRRAENV